MLFIFYDFIVNFCSFLIKTSYQKFKIDDERGEKWLKIQPFEASQQTYIY